MKNKILNLLKKHWRSVDKPPSNSCRVLMKFKDSDSLSTGWYFIDSGFQVDSTQHRNSGYKVDAYVNIDDMFHNN